MTEASPPAPPRKLRVVWRWLGRVALLVVLVGVVWIAYLWWSLSTIAAAGQRELAGIVADLDATDPRWRWEDIADRPAVPDDQNALRVIAGFQDLYRGWDQYQGTHSNFNYSLQYGLNHRLHPILLREMRTEWNKRPESIPRAASIKDFPNGRSDIQLQPNVWGTLLPHLGDCRIAAWLLTLDAELRLEVGRASLTPEQFEAMFNLASALRHEPLLDGQLTRLALRKEALRSIERRLAMSQPDEPFLAALQVQVEAGTEVGPSDVGLRSERAEMHQQFETLRRGELALPEFLAYVRYGGSETTFWSRTFDSLYHSKLDEDHAAYLRWCSRMLAILRLPLPEQAAAVAEYEREVNDFLKSAKSAQRFLITQRFLPDLSVLAPVVVRDRSLFLCARAGLAAERYRRANGAWPGSLADLVPAYLPAVPRDPITGGPLVLEERADGIEIVARNTEGQRFRLWHGPQRALPALRLFEERPVPFQLQEPR
jgi:hypothetical protein